MVPAGNADKQGVVQAGDVVLQCSATVLKAGEGGGGGGGFAGKPAVPLFRSVVLVAVVVGA